MYVELVYSVKQDSREGGCKVFKSSTTMTSAVAKSLCTDKTSALDFGVNTV